ncbi:MAG: hypothetical protein Fues2KO_00030 [Fuerstiella sp.]
MSSLASTQSTTALGGRNLLGRSFLHPVFDYALIGGVLSLLFIPLVYFTGLGQSASFTGMLPWVILLSNSTHFASSTVRLYTKPGTNAELPFLTMALPIITFVVITLAVFRADLFGRWFQWLYLTWSPYHYAAQAYGIAVLYSFRSGCRLTRLQKRLLWLSALCPFIYVTLQSTYTHLFAWLFDEYSIVNTPTVERLMQACINVAAMATFATPILSWLWIFRSQRQAMPLISFLAVFSNGIWFVVFPLVQGFIWVTVFHGIQYLAIVMLFHVKDQMQQPGNRRSPVAHAILFYGISLVLGYGLFNAWPQFYRMLGFDLTESMLMVAAAINIHHFIVDAYIWKTRPGDSNRRVIEDSPGGSA